MRVDCECARALHSARVNDQGGYTSAFAMEMMTWPNYVIFIGG